MNILHGVHELNDTVGTAHVDSSDQVVRVVFESTEGPEGTMIWSGIAFSPFIVDIFSLEKAIAGIEG